MDYSKLKIIDFVESALEDKFGISESAMTNLHLLITSNEDSELRQYLASILRKTKLIDGRYYLNQGDNV
jgi:hypothetical protein